MSLCTHVKDGDTLVLRDGLSLVTVRLAGVMADELDSQNELTRTKALIAYSVLNPLCLNYELSLHLDDLQPDKDKYGRLIRYVRRAHDDLDICYEMIRGGWAPAWVAGRFSQSQRYHAAAGEALSLKLGRISHLLGHCIPPSAQVFKDL